MGTQTAEDSTEENPRGCGVLEKLGRRHGGPARQCRKSKLVDLQQFSRVTLVANL
jgi:hypothetical protein